MEFSTTYSLHLASSFEGLIENVYPSDGWESKKNAVTILFRCAKCLSAEMERTISKSTKETLVIPDPRIDRRNLRSKGGVLISSMKGNELVDGGNADIMRLEVLHLVPVTVVRFEFDWFAKLQGLGSISPFKLNEEGKALVFSKVAGQNEEVGAVTIISSFI